MPKNGGGLPLHPAGGHPQTPGRIESGPKSDPDACKSALGQGNTIRIYFLLIICSDLRLSISSKVLAFGST